jgi:probable FeS assembly SUF system protein SufT
MAGHGPPESAYLKRQVRAVQIPDGIETTLEPQVVVITQALGGAFTIQLEDQRKFRIEGRDAEVLGKEVPEGALPAPKEGAAPVTPEEATELAWARLKTVHDPEIPLNIVDLGLVYELDVHARGDGQLVAFVTMTLTAPGCGMGDFIIQDVERAIKTIPGVATVEAKVVFDPVWNPHRDMSDAAKLQMGL